jgi:hypothetical protein
MKKGDRIRCNRACGDLEKWEEGICEQPPVDGFAGLGMFRNKIYGINLDFFEIIQSDSALNIQQGGTHYKDLKIQPIEYIHANNIPFAEGCAIKYLTRWRSKGGLQDLEKAKHFIELLIELEKKNG